ncbi:hypothetical protein BYT27DRAFT_7264848 [Phlegmacium glaucopus]|nr:hypothetical protein BYT27DRAFT_7264848 [Phlegmacium glaucopus]
MRLLSLALPRSLSSPKSHSRLPVVVSSTGGNQSRGRAKSLVNFHLYLRPPSSSDNELSNKRKPKTSDNEREKEKDDFPTSIPDRTSTSTPATPRQYGVERQVIRGSGCDFEDLGTGSKRSSKRQSGMLCRSSLESTLESPPDSKSEDVENGNVEDEELLKEPSIPIEADGDIPLDFDLKDPTKPKHVKGDDINTCINIYSVNNTGGSVGEHSARNSEKPRIGGYRNAPPVPAGLPSRCWVQTRIYTRVNINCDLHTRRRKTVKTNAKKPSFPPVFLSWRGIELKAILLLASASGSKAKHDISTKTLGKRKLKPKPNEQVVEKIGHFPSTFRRSGERSRGSKYFEASSLVLGLGSVQAVEPHRGVLRSGEYEDENREGDGEEEEEEEEDAEEKDALIL